MTDFFPQVRYIPDGLMHTLLVDLMICAKVSSFFNQQSMRYSSIEIIFRKKWIQKEYSRTIYMLPTHQ